MNSRMRNGSSDNVNASPLFGSMKLRRAKQRLGKFVIPRLPITRHVFNHFRWELNALWVGLKNGLNPIFFYRINHIRSQNDLSVNVGCGPNIIKDWINLDLMNIPEAIRFDCRRKLPFRNESVVRIRCEHFFEHLDPIEEAPLFLQSCLRVLKKSGVLRIVVPDAERYLRAYQSGKQEDWKELGWDLNKLPSPFKSQMDVINHVFRQEEEHRYAYDFETLENMLKEAGFIAIHKSKFNFSVDPKLSKDLPHHRFYSLYVDAIK